MLTGPVMWVLEPFRRFAQMCKQETDWLTWSSPSGEILTQAHFKCVAFGLAHAVLQKTGPLFFICWPFWKHHLITSLVFFTFNKMIVICGQHLRPPALFTSRTSFISLNFLEAQSWPMVVSAVDRDICPHTGDFSWSWSRRSPDMTCPLQMMNLYFYNNLWYRYDWNNFYPDVVKTWSHLEHQRLLALFPSTARTPCRSLDNWNITDFCHIIPTRDSLTGTKHQRHGHNCHGYFTKHALNSVSTLMDRWNTVKVA